MRVAGRLIGLAALLGLAVIAFAMFEARRDPIVRTATLALPGYPAGARPLRVLLISDTHMSQPDMPPERLARLVGRFNDLRPDLILLAGDYVSDKGVGGRPYPTAASIAPLAGLHAPLGVFAVLGNHEHRRPTGAADAAAAFARTPIRLLQNEVVRVGPIRLAGLDDFHRLPSLRTVLAAMDEGGAPLVAFSHTPDLAVPLRGHAPLLLAGHTHCGQIRLPMLPQLAHPSSYGTRYLCGIRHDPGITVVTTGGIGTSVLPMRLGAPGDVWLLTLGASATAGSAPPPARRGPPAA